MMMTTYLPSNTGGYYSGGQPTSYLQNNQANLYNNANYNLQNNTTLSPTLNQFAQNNNVRINPQFSQYNNNLAFSPTQLTQNNRFDDRYSPTFNQTTLAPNFNQYNQNVDYRINPNFQFTNNTVAPTFNQLNNRYDTRISPQFNQYNQNVDYRINPNFQFTNNNTTLAPNFTNNTTNNNVDLTKIDQRLLVKLTDGRVFAPVNNRYVDVTNNYNQTINNRYNQTNNNLTQQQLVQNYYAIITGQPQPYPVPTPTPTPTPAPSGGGGGEFPWWLVGLLGVGGVAWACGAFNGGGGAKAEEKPADSPSSRTPSTTYEPETETPSRRTRTREADDEKPCTTTTISATAGGDIKVNTNVGEGTANNPGNLYRDSKWKHTGTAFDKPGTYTVADDSSGDTKVKFTIRTRYANHNSHVKGTLIDKANLTIGGKALEFVAGKAPKLGGETLEEGCTKTIGSGNDKVTITYSGKKLTIKTEDDTYVIEDTQIKTSLPNSKGGMQASLSIGVVDKFETGEDGKATQTAKDNERGALLDLNKGKYRNVAEAFNANAN
jgi:hypothetical protein